MNQESKNILRSVLIPGIFVLCMLAVRLLEMTLHTHFTWLGVLPLHAEGLPGILTSPFVHEDWAHLYANVIPFLVLGTSLFYFYRRVALTAFLLIWLLTGMWVWLGAREAWHIGASGVVYGLTTFIFVSGLLRRDSRLMALSMFVIFLYGGMIWGVFPDFFPDRQISWEAHLWGAVAGIVVAVFYRSVGPQRKLYSWETGDDEVPPWFPGETNPPEQTIHGPELPADYPKTPVKQDPPEIRYIYLKGKKESETH